MLFTILQQMIVPEFKLKQNDRFLEVFIRVPYIKVSACEFYIQGKSFKFYLKPYLLSLAFEQSLKDVEEPAKAVYYHEKYILQVHLEKAVVGEFFEKLDIISSLLNNKKEKKTKRTLVELVSQNSTINELTEENGDANQYNYGFGMNYSNVFDNLEQQSAQLFSFNPKSTPLCQRFALSKQVISKQFDIDSYFYDKYQNQQQISYILKDPSPSQYLNSISQKYKGVQINHETYKLKHRIPKKDILLTAEARQNISKEIVSILFSYIYELVCMNGEFGPESAKTINKTSIVLSCNYNYSDEGIGQMLLDCYQRCFTYSLYRTQKVAQNAKNILETLMDREAIIAVFEDLYRIFQGSEPRYLLNRIYLEDYLIYLYSDRSSEAIEKIILQLRQVKINEGDLNMQKLNEEGQIRLLLESQLPIKHDVRSEQQKRKLIEEMEKMNMLD